MIHDHRPSGAPPEEVFTYGAKEGSQMAALLSDIGVLLSRALKHGDTVEEMAGGIGRLGGGKTPASLLGAIIDRVAGVMRTSEAV